VCAQETWRFLLPEQLAIEVRSPNDLPQVAVPGLPPPVTVTRRSAATEVWHLSLDEAMRIALENAEVVRVLTGTSASSSGRTIYDPAISNSGIDRARATFDPTISVNNRFNRFDSPQAFIDPNDSSRTLIDGTVSDDYDLRAALSKRTITGGTAEFGVNSNRGHTHVSPLPLNPSRNSTVNLGYTQPLFQGAGIDVNLAPILLARIDAERSFFQLKDSVQGLVGGVVDGYWNLVFARTDLWAREQQAEQTRKTVEIAKAKFQVGLADKADVAQTEAAYANFLVAVISSRSNVYQREAALRNLLGLPPTGNRKMIPVTPPVADKLTPAWAPLLQLAQQQRPDVIELKLILEADQQLLIEADNRALPRVDATMQYRWNGLEGTMPDRSVISSTTGQFTGWTFGVNFSVPLGLRRERALLRERELVNLRDEANLRQALHSVSHQLADNLRSLDLAYASYEARKLARAASLENLKAQGALFTTGGLLGRDVIILNVLQAITSWGDAVSAESQSLIEYNSQLVQLERNTGTILDTHGVRFYEERYGSIGPLGRMFAARCYPQAMRPAPGPGRYQSTGEAAERVFGLEPPPGITSSREGTNKGETGPSFERPQRLPPADPPAPVAPSPNSLQFRNER